MDPATLAGTSGTARRKRAEKRREIPPNLGDDSSSPEEVQPFRERGRPPTIAEYVGITKAKAKYLALRQKEIDIRSQELFLESAVEEADIRSKRSLPQEDDIREQFRDLALAAFRERARDALWDVDKVADTFRNFRFFVFVRALSLPLRPEQRSRIWRGGLTLQTREFKTRARMTSSEKEWTLLRRKSAG